MPDAEIKPVIHVVEDEPDVRDALAMLVRSVGYRAQTYPNADEFLARYRPEHAGCLLADVRMPGMSGLELQERLSREDPALPAIIMTGHGDVPMAVRAMKAGAFDFIEKPFNDQVLLDRLAEAIAQARRSGDTAAGRRLAAARYAQLTPREREVMAGIVAGRLNKLIADDLGLSVRTVEIHRAHIMEKMQASSLSALVRMAMLLENA
ncbi:MAG TPA: response regulator [Rhodocyclaceae bacterium]|nr:response regulator [Rhodocyclaceae bacterium]